MRVFKRWVNDTSPPMDAGALFDQGPFFPLTSPKGLLTFEYNHRETVPTFVALLPRARPAPHHHLASAARARREDPPRPRARVCGYQSSLCRGEPAELREGGAVRRGTRPRGVTQGTRSLPRRLVRARQGARCPSQPDLLLKFCGDHSPSSHY